MSQHPHRPAPALPPPPQVYAAVFDGHGGSATADWLQANLLNYVEKVGGCRLSAGCRKPDKQWQPAELCGESGRVLRCSRGPETCDERLLSNPLGHVRREAKGSISACRAACRGARPSARCPPARTVLEPQQPGAVGDRGLHQGRRGERAVLGSLQLQAGERQLQAARSLVPSPHAPSLRTPARGAQRILAPKGGFLGIVGERGIGGSKCGSTAAVAMVYRTPVGAGGARHAARAVSLGEHCPAGQDAASHGRLLPVGRLPHPRPRPAAEGHQTAADSQLLPQPDACSPTPAGAPEQKGTSQLLTANAGDARILLVRGDTAVQLTEDHVPDNEDERDRIEKYNPNPRLPLVRKGCCRRLLHCCCCCCRRCHRRMPRPSPPLPCCCCGRRIHQRRPCAPAPLRPCAPAPLIARPAAR